MSTDRTDYKATLFLPRTDFPMKAGLPKLEPTILERWEEMNLYRRQREVAAGSIKLTHAQHDLGAVAAADNCTIVQEGRPFGLACLAHSWLGPVACGLDRLCEADAAFLCELDRDGTHCLVVVELCSRFFALREQQCSGSVRC